MFILKRSRRRIHNDRMLSDNYRIMYNYRMLSDNDRMLSVKDDPLKYMRKHQIGTL